MRTHILPALITVISLWIASSALAQGRDKGKGDERDEAKDAPARAVAPGAVGGMGAASNVLMQVLDADGDGTISAKELRNAVRALKSLDTNHDGKLTPDELMVGGAPGLPPMGGDRGAGAGAVPAGGGGPGGGAAAGGVPAAGAAPGLGGFGGFGAAGGGGLGGGAPAAAAGAGHGPGGAAGMRVPGSGLPSVVGKLMGFDKNRDGKVTKDEVPEELLPLFQRLDLDRDGAIDIRELRALRAG